MNWITRNKNADLQDGDNICMLICIVCMDQWNLRCSIPVTDTSYFQSVYIAYGCFCTGHNVLVNGIESA